MKKFFALLLSVMLVLTISIPAFAAGTATVACTSANEVKQGETLTVMVTVSDCDPFKSMAVTPSYDKKVFELVSGEWVLTEAMLTNFNGTNGAIAYSSAVTKNGNIFKLVLKVKADAPVGKTSVKADAVIKNGDTTIPVKVTAKEVKVTCSTHTFGDWAVAKEATCTAAGSEKRTCSVCGVSETKEVKALGHNYGKATVTKEATCTENGVSTKICDRCNKKATVAIKATDHAFGEWETVKAATCTEEGTLERKCANCDATETQTIAKIDHEFGEMQVVKEATETETGLKEAKCKHCSEVEQETIPCVAPVAGGVDDYLLWIIIGAAAVVVLVIVIVVIAKKKKKD
ncbi:MAG: hypothetical protein IKU56_02565 [Clostridia bacterium]|nr:hypothetical protein [Clostridia bacterium]